VLKNSDDTTTYWTLDNFSGATVDSVIWSIVANETAVKALTGGGDGYKVIDLATVNLYSYDLGNDKWTPLPGNRYTTAGLPTAADYTILTGICVFDTTLNYWKYWDGSAWQIVQEHPVSALPGIQQRTKFAYDGTTTITLDPACYYHSGTIENFLSWDSQLTFTFGSGGSNADSEDLGNNEWHYLYFDDSALSGATITAARLLNNTTAPTWNAAKHGWYHGTNTNDMCIGAFRTNGSAQIEPIYHDGGDYVQYDVEETDATSFTAQTWTDQTLTIPGFATKAMETFRCSPGGSTYNATLDYRVNGASGNGHNVCSVRQESPNGPVWSNIEVYTDDSQILELKWDAAVGAGCNMYTHGWFFPKGM
jgi:hypothetical protein